MKSRVGIIKYSFDKDSQRDIDNCHEVFALLKFIPLKVEFTPNGRELECFGISPLFEECEFGIIPPRYELIVHTVEGKVDSIEAKKIEG